MSQLIWNKNSFLVSEIFTTCLFGIIVGDIVEMIWGWIVICNVILFLLCYALSNNALGIYDHKNASSGIRHNHIITQQILFVGFCINPNYIPSHDYESCLILHFEWKLNYCTYFCLVCFYYIGRSTNKLKSYG
jgi:hypothetical protein